MQGLEQAIGFQYRFSSTPFFIAEDLYRQLVETTEAVIKLLAAPRYFEARIEDRSTGPRSTASTREPRWALRGVITGFTAIPERS